MSFTHGKKARAPGRGPAGSAPKESTSSGKLQVIPAGERAPSRVVRHDQVFGAHLTLEHPERLSREGPLDYTATLFAKSPGEPHVLTVGETSGTLPPGETIIKLNGRIVSPGVYRLEAHLTVAGATRSSTTLPGGFIHVY